VTVDLAAFFKAEFSEHHDVARCIEAALAGAFAGLVGACVTSIRTGGKLMFFGNWCEDMQGAWVQQDL
jgi:D-sedoheptulose 7-phosphate isomerase